MRLLRASRPKRSAEHTFTVSVMSDDTRITVRLSQVQLARLDDLAADAGISRSLVLRRLLDAAGSAAGAAGAAPSDHLDRGDLLALLEERARAGSAPAIRELLQRVEGEAELARLRELTT